MYVIGLVYIDTSINMNINTIWLHSRIGFIYTYMYVYVDMYICVYIHKCIHMYIHSFIYISQRADNWLGATAFTFIAGVAGNNS